MPTRCAYQREWNNANYRILLSWSLSLPLFFCFVCVLFSSFRWISFFVRTSCFVFKCSVIVCALVRFKPFFRIFFFCAELLLFQLFVGCEWMWCWFGWESKTIRTCASSFFLSSWCLFLISRIKKASRKMRLCAIYVL